LANYVIGLSPTSPNDLLNLSIMSTPPGFQAIFSPWEGGRIYGLQSATTILGPLWTTLSNLSPYQNTNGQGVIVFTNAVGAPTFYRLSIQLSP
jgi:hypothetical protein